MRWLPALTLAIVFLSCTSDKLPKGILPEDKMQAVFWDFMMADVYTMDELVKDSSKVKDNENVKLQQAIFHQHHVTKEEFYKSYNYYISHPGKMTIMMDSMMAKQTRQKNKEDSTVRKRINVLRDTTLKAID